MSLFVPKEWKDRLVEFAGRRKLTNVSTGEETTVDVSRAEGKVSQEGHAFSAANMNDLEQRIKDGFDKVDSDLGGVKFGIDGEGNRCYLGADGSLIPFRSIPYELSLVTCLYHNQESKINVAGYNTMTYLDTSTSIHTTVTADDGTVLTTTAKGGTVLDVSKYSYVSVKFTASNNSYYSIISYTLKV